ncbi:hypothetical protein GC209_07470 [bacterium]|nr:hypothetical protein [bacterium]
MTVAGQKGALGAPPGSALPDPARGCAKGPGAQPENATDPCRDPSSAEPCDPLVLRPEDRAGAGPVAARRRRGRRGRRGLLGGRLVLLVLMFGMALLTLELVGRPVHLPVWLVAEIETRVNRSLAGALPDSALAVGGIEVSLGDNWVPHLVLEDLRVLQPGGQTLLTLPEIYLNLDPAGLLQGQIRAQSLRIVGARLALRRDRDGHFDLALGSGEGPRIASLADAFDMLDRVFALPALTHLRSVEAEAMSLSLTDLRAGRKWEVGDGHLSLENREAELAAQFSMSLVAGGSTPAQAVFTAVAQKGAGVARLSVQVDRIAARDLAAQTPVLGWLGVLDAPISGRLACTIDTQGIESMDGRLDIGAGALQPSPSTTPIAFDHATLGLGYDPAGGRIVLTDLAVQSRTLHLTAKGQSYLVDGAGQAITGALSGRIPAAFVGQIAISDLSVDPEGLFAAPVQFNQGSVDVRLRLDPFSLDIGQLALSQAGAHLGLAGQVVADAGGWRAAIDLTLNRISRDRLLALWPLRLVPGTRAWVAENIRNADLSDVRASVRIAPGTEARAELAYSFNKAELQFMPKMPPVTDADGYAVIQDKTYTLVMSHGQVTPPEGGAINVSGSVFAVPDILAHPALAHIDLRASSGLTAMLSLLDQPPFHFLQKAGQPVDLGSGTVQATARIVLPLIPRVMPWDVTLKANATVTDFASDVLVKGHPITAPVLQVTGTSTQLTIAGKGMIGKVPFDATFVQDIPAVPHDAGGPAAPWPDEPSPEGQEGTPALAYTGPLALPPPPARITGHLTLSQDAVAEFGLGLPRGMVTGAADAEVAISLPKGTAGELHLTSALDGMTLAIPELGWRKGAQAAGKLETDVRLGPVPEISRLTLSGPGLQAQGQVKLKPGGALDVARFDKVTMGGWLDGAVEIRGRGANVPVGFAVTSGSIDLRKFPANRSGGGTAAGSPLTIAVQSLRVTDGIRLNGFTGDFSLKGGFNGTFTGSVNGEAPVSGTAVPTANGTAVRIRSDDAGQAIKAAGLFATAHGGDLDMTLLPRTEPGEYDGKAMIRHIRVNNGSVMADLLSAISVIGLLQQLGGEGIVFERAEAQFHITPIVIDIQKGSAIGASMGVSLEGLYHSDTSALDMRGVVSPIYLLNGIGSILTRKGEGLFGFAYRLRGSAAKPVVSVNPLSILTPGMFRDLFRAPAPSLPQSPADAAPQIAPQATPQIVPQTPTQPPSQVRSPSQTSGGGDR